MRISGPEVPPFQTAYRGTSGKIDRLGDRFPIVVDPSDNAYMLVS